MSTDFPARISEVTPSWLGDVLGSPVRSFDVANVGAGKGMMGDIFRLDLNHGDQPSTSVVIKFSADREDLRIAAKRAGIFEREVNFYRHIAPSLRCRIPKCFGCWFDSDTAEFAILMEYIDADSSVNQVSGVSLRQARTVVRELAALHIPAENVAEFSAFIMPASSDARRTNQRMFVGNGWEKLKPIVPASLRVSFTADEMAERLVAAIDVLAAQPYFLLHGDARPDNLLFTRGRDEVALVDWQGLMFGPREWDLGYFMAQGLRTHDRREWFDELVDEYLREMPFGRENVNRAAFVSNVNKTAWFSFGVACSLFTIADTTQAKTIELAASMGERALATLVDAGEL